MENIYEEIDDYWEDDEEENPLGNEGISKQRYEKLIGRLFRSYAGLNISIFLFSTVLAIDIAAGGGNLSFFSLLTDPLAIYTPTLIEYTTDSLIGAFFDILSLLSLLAIVISVFYLYSGKRQSANINLDDVTIVDADNDDDTLDRLFRQKEYIIRGKQILPLAVISGLLFGMVISFAISELGLL